VSEKGTRHRIENNKKLAKCKECGDWYCKECSIHYAWKDFCSHECMEEDDRKKEKQMQIILNAK